MSQENVEAARSMYAATARGDWSRMSVWLDPEVEFVAVGGPDPGVVASGFTALVGAWRGYLSAWENFRLDVQDIRALDEGRVLALTRRGGRGRVSGMEIEDLAGAEGADVLHYRDGKVVRYLSYWDRGRALADLGLEE